jgi:PAS domain S-box-containing protein
VTTGPSADPRVGVHPGSRLGADVGPAVNRARRPSAVDRLMPAPGRRHPALDRLAALAAQLLGSESSQVSLLGEVQNVAGAAGLVADASHVPTALADSLCTVTAQTGGPLVVPDTRADGRVAGLPPVASGAVGAYLGVPLVAEGQAVGALCVFDPTPRHWSGDDVVILQQLAASVMAELELSAVSAEFESSQMRWSAAIEAAGIGSFDWDLRTEELRWDDRLMEMFGYDDHSFGGTIAAFNDRVHPDDVPRVTQALHDAIVSCGLYDAEYRVVLPSGTTRWVAARGRAICDESGRAVRVVGAAYDTTEVRAGESRVTRILEAMPAAFYSLDRAWRFTYVNAEAERLLRRTRDELLGGVLWELFPAAVGTVFEENYRRAVDSGQPTSFEAYYPAPLDSWYELQAWPSPEGLSVYFLDITARRAAQQAADRARERAELLAEVTAQLAGTLDAEEAVGRLAQLVVPALADWSLVTLLDDDGGIRDVGWWHSDPELRDLTERYSKRRLTALVEKSFVAHVLRTGEAVTRASGVTEALLGVLQPGEAAEMLKVLAPESFAILPLQGHGRTVGLLCVFTGPGRDALTAEDLTSAREVAARAGLALDNARLYRQHQRIAEGLQRSLLTDPPEPDHIEVAVRYTPAAEVAQVGGDWYDAFLQPDGATVLVIGDVVGHDTEAAAAMGQVRGLLRGIAFTTGDGPAAVLARLDAAIEGLRVGTTATAVVARVQQDADERARGLTRVRWSNAGHPPPMVIEPDGSVAVLAGAEADLLLGIDPSVQREESEVVLDRGSTVLLYTDGLVERRGSDLEDGLSQLHDTLLDLGDRPLDELCDAVLARMLPERPEDDVALVAVRLHPQDGPRPPEAGPGGLPATFA